MKSNLYNKSFLSVISILIISSSVIFPQHGKDRIGVTRPPVKSNPSIAVEQRKPSYNPPTSTTPRTPEPKQIQRPVVDNPAPRIEQKKQIINETPQRNYEPRIIERQPETKVNNFTDRKKQVVIEPGPRESVIKQPVREEKRPTPPTVLHNPPEVINQPMIEYTEPNCDPPRRPNPHPFPCPQPVYDPPPSVLIEYIPSPPRPINRLTLKEQAIQNYYAEYYFDALIDFNAAIAKDSLDFELHFWRGMTWFQLENYDSSVVDLSRYLKVYDDAEAFYYRGLSNFYLINKIEAYHDFLKANELEYPKAADMLDKYFKDYHIL